MGRPTDVNWQLCRLRRSTVAELRKWAEGLDHARERGLLTVDPGEEGWSIDQLIRILLQRDLSKRERSRAPRKGSKARRSDQPSLSDPASISTNGVNTSPDPPLRIGEDEREAV